MFSTLTAPNSLGYIVVKLCVLALAILIWWIVVSYPTTPVV